MMFTCLPCALCWWLRDASLYLFVHISHISTHIKILCGRKDKLSTFVCARSCLLLENCFVERTTHIIWKKFGVHQTPENITRESVKCEEEEKKSSGRMKKFQCKMIFNLFHINIAWLIVSIGILLITFERFTACVQLEELSPGEWGYYPEI